MTVVTQNAGTVTSTSWTNPTNAQGACDSNCASIVKSDNASGAGTHTCDCSDFGFAIPAGSTLNSVKFGFHQQYGTLCGITGELRETMINGGLVFCLSVNPNAGWSLVCTDATDRESIDVKDLLDLTVDILNNETFTFNFALIISAHAPFNHNHYAYVDCVWITVDYTEAPAPTTPSVKLSMRCDKGPHPHDRTYFKKSLKKSFGYTELHPF